MVDFNANCPLSLGLRCFGRHSRWQKRLLVRGKPEAASASTAKPWVYHCLKKGFASQAVPGVAWDCRMATGASFLPAAFFLNLKPGAEVDIQVDIECLTWNLSGKLCVSAHATRCS